MKYVYGPVYSWRLGKSLGIDLLSQEDKICTFDCVYCQVGDIRYYTVERHVYVPTRDVIKEIRSLPKAKIDYITFSGRGEPTLAKNLGEVIKAVKQTRKEKICVLTNSSLMYREDVRRDLSLADLVECKIDAGSDKVFELVNKGGKDIRFENIIDGIKKFKKTYKGKLAVQVMFVKENLPDAGKIRDLVENIVPDEIHLNTPLRSPAQHAISKKEMSDVKKCFSGMNAISVYDRPKKQITPLSAISTAMRRSGTGKDRL